MWRFRGALDRSRASPILGRAQHGLRRGSGNEWERRSIPPREPGPEPAMNDTSGTITVRVHASIAEIPAETWDACAGDVNPTVCHTFLQALEESGSTTARTGWADAYERAGGRYYPKLLSAVPFTPVPGPRILLRSGTPAEARDHLLAGMIEFTKSRRISSLHVNFPEPGEAEALSEAGFLQRLGQQFHWTNEGYRDFDDFLEALNSRKRKAVRKERREALARGLDIEVLTGSDLEPRHWDAFFEFYLATSDRKWGSAYLNRRFFAMIGERMPEN